MRGVEHASALQLVGVNPELTRVQIQLLPGEGAPDGRPAFSDWTLYGRPASNEVGEHAPIVVTLGLPPGENEVSVAITDGENELSTDLLGEFRVELVTPGREG